VSLESSSNYKLISSDRAIEAAHQAMKELCLDEWAGCDLLKNPQFQMLTPILVRNDPGKEDVDVTYSYMVPVRLQSDQSRSGVPLIRLCILVDGTDGTFEEVTNFHEPVAYLPKEAALRAVAAEMHVPVEKLANADAEWMFQSGEITRVRAYPFWKIVVAERIYYVDQDGKLYTQLERGKGGS
jgi:hypothetical protein